MAQHSIVRWVDLADGLVLSPERYDPRRESLHLQTAKSCAILLREVAEVSRQTISARKVPDQPKQYLVLDTRDAAEGILIGRKGPVCLRDIGSTKKVIQPGDVIVSRLRPYLRQVAYVDNQFVARWSRQNNIELVGSTEFFVLRPKDTRNIAFLAPYLLTAPVQEVLNASQEGGHHPRFQEDTLLNLPIPESLIERREVASNSVRDAIDLYRQSEAVISQVIDEAEVSFVSDSQT